MASTQTTRTQSEGEQRLAAPSISMPKGGGAIRGVGEKFAANPVTGTGSMSLRLATSPGRSGFGPQLSLSYDSGAANGPFGFGWSLSLPQIMRKTDKALPQYLDAGNQTSSFCPAPKIWYRFFKNSQNLKKKEETKMANGKSDIKLLDDFDGQVKVEAPDFCVDGGQGRRGIYATTGAYRRALVHEGGDKLTVNFGFDYHGGVTINGLKAINSVNTTLQLDPSALFPDKFFLTITGNTEIVGFLKTKVEVQAKAPAGLAILPDQKVKVDLAELLNYLLSRVRELEDHVQRLGSAVGTEGWGLIGPLGGKIVSRQDNWRWCKKCEGLFFAGNPTQGKCPADGQPHSQEGSGDYRLLLIQQIQPQPPIGFVPNSTPLNR